MNRFGIAALVMALAGPAFAEGAGEKRDVAVGCGEAELTVRAGARSCRGAWDRDGRTGERLGRARDGDGAGDDSGLSANRCREQHEQHCSGDGEAREAWAQESSRCEGVFSRDRVEEGRIEWGRTDVKVRTPGL